MSYSRKLREAAVGLAVVGLVAGSTAILAATPALASVHAGPSAGHPAAGQSVQPGWPSAGQNNDDTHDNPDERAIGVSNVGRLAPRWVFTTAGDVSATATVAAGTVFVPDWGGKLWAINAETGKADWSHAIAGYDGVPGDVSRTSPAYWNGEIVIGTGAQTISALDGAYVVGINARNGTMLWRTQVDSNPAAIVTSSPTVDDGIVYVGTSSKDQDLSAPPTFRGSVLALSATTGKILWRTRTVPAGYTGGAVWGSQPVVDHATGLLYVGVGDNYSAPHGVCTSPAQADCTPRGPADHIDSVLGLNLTTGAIDWYKDTLSADTWTIAMPNDSPDYDFGADPQLYTTDINGKPTQLLGIGQKSGVYWALNPATGAVVWQAQAGPGGTLGGIEWGTATDGRHIFIAEANSSHVPTTITTPNGTKTTITSGFFTALNAATGAVDWQVPDPQGGETMDDSFVSSANGVMYAGSAAATGTNMYALDASTGKILWSYASGGAEFAGASIAGGTVYWGSGYHNGDNDKLYAFTLDGR